MTPELTTLFASILHWVVGGMLGIALLFFVFQFLVPGFRVGGELRRVRANLSAMKASGPVLDLDRVRSEAMVSTALHRCWDEFRDTLHGQKQPSRQGVLEVTRWRATAAANAFFTDQALVDAPLRTEFYKHLPGILTGIGIIGTFSGLILGLQAFGRVDLGDAEKARLGLQALLGTVGGAFVVSGAAIALAMLLTTIEKIVINGLYTRLESLCGVIDSLFEAGAGEDYLQRLVEAAETSATQATQMKESLVTDLKQVLTELTQQQIATMTSTSSQLGQAITTSLEDGLKEPLARISEAVQTVGASQGDAVNKLLTDVLSSFTAQMENMFGGQMRGMGEMLTQTASTIQQASQRFEQLIGQVQQAGSGATEAMAEAMGDAIARMHAGQSEANEQMRAFVELMKQSVAKGQSESAELTMSMMKELSESTSALVKGLQDQARNAQQDHSKAQLEAAEQMRAVVQQLKETAAQGQAETSSATVKLLQDIGQSGAALVDRLQSQSDAAQRAHVERQLSAGDQLRGLIEQASEGTARTQAAATEASSRLLKELGDATTALVRNLQEQAANAQQEHSGRQATLAAQTAELLAKQSEQVSRLADAVQRAESSMRDTVERIKAATDSHLDRLGLGAERLKAASDSLSGNLGLMKASSDGLNGTAERLNAAASVFSAALSATQQTLADQKAVRDALAEMVAGLRGVIDTAKRDATVNASLVDGLKESSQRLIEAQKATVTNLEEATVAIGDAHGKFAKQVEVTLRDGNRVFHEELAQATGLLKGAIQDLGNVLDNLPTPA